MDAQEDRWRQAVDYADKWLPAYRNARDEFAGRSIFDLERTLAGFNPESPNPRVSGRFDGFDDERYARRRADDVVYQGDRR